MPVHVGTSSPARLGDAAWEIRNATGYVLRVEGALTDALLERVLAALFLPGS